MSLLNYISSDELISMQSLYLDFTGNSSHFVTYSGEHVVSRTPSAYCNALRSRGTWCDNACRDIATHAMKSGQAQEALCPGKRVIRVIPLYEQGKLLGVLLASITGPPANEATLNEVSCLYNIPVSDLSQLSRDSTNHSFCQPHVEEQVNRLAESLINLAVGRASLLSDQRKRLVSDALRTWVDTGNAAVMLSDDAGRVVFANNRFLELSELSENHILGQGRKEILTQVNTIVPDFGDVHYSFDNAGIMVAEALPLNTPDGQRLVVDYLKPRGAMPRRLLEEALNIIDSAIVILDHSDRVIFANRTAEETLGFCLTDSYGQSLRQVHDALPFLHSHSHFPTKAMQQRVTLTLDSEERAFIYSSNVIRSSADDRLGSVLTLMDITELEQAESQRINREKLALIGQLAAGMAHELRNPLTVISGFAQLMKRRITTEPEVTYLELVVDELKHTVRLIDDFLTLAKPGDPKMHLISSVDFVGNLRLLVESQCLLKEVELRIEHEDAVFMADEDQLRQVVLNLVKNSLEAMETSPRRKLTMKICPCADGTEITIEDTGKGMSDEELEKIFTPFYTNKNRGTGLGLSLSQSLIRNMRGSLSVKSIPNQGTCVSVILPC